MLTWRSKNGPSPGPHPQNTAPGRYQPAPPPAGLVWGEAPGQILLHPDEAVRGAFAAVFDRFAASGSARQVWLWLRENGLQLPSLRDGQLAWTMAPTRRPRRPVIGKVPPPTTTLPPVGTPTRNRNPPCR